MTAPRRPGKPAIIETGKVPMHLLLMPCMAEVARALEQGNLVPGRGPFNWRAAQVRDSDMIDAALRHIWAARSGNSRDRKSRQRHLAHAVARLLIDMDAEDHGNLIAAPGLFKAAKK